MKIKVYNLNCNFQGSPSSQLERYGKNAEAFIIVAIA